MVAQLKESPRLARILRVLRILGSGSAPSIDDLVRDLGCCRRTVYRDLHLLRASGAHVGFDPIRRGYTTYNSPLCSMALTEEESAALVIAAATSPVMQSKPLSAILHGSVAKLVCGATRDVQASIKILTDELRGDSRHQLTAKQKSNLRKLLSKMKNPLASVARNGDRS